MNETFRQIYERRKMGPHPEMWVSGRLEDGRRYCAHYTIDRSQPSPTFEVFTSEEYFKGDPEAIAWDKEDYAREQREKQGCTDERA